MWMVIGIVKRRERERVKKKKGSFGDVKNCTGSKIVKILSREWCLFTSINPPGTDSSKCSPTRWVNKANKNRVWIVNWIWTFYDSRWSKSSVEGEKKFEKKLERTDLCNLLVKKSFQIKLFSLALIYSSKFHFTTFRLQLKHFFLIINNKLQQKSFHLQMMKIQVEKRSEI